MRRAARALPLSIPLSFPVWGLWLLIHRPSLDAHLRHIGVHFWLVLGSASVSLVLAVVLLRAVRRRGDARLFLVSLVFQLNAGFLGLHALATPGILLDGPNPGFDEATPVGLLLGGLAALASSLDLGSPGARRLMRWQSVVAAVPWVLFATWAVVSLAQLPPLSTVGEPPGTSRAVSAAAVAGAPLYLVAAYRYLRVYRRRRAAVLLSVMTAFVLLAEAMIAVAFGRAWHASWWEWHVLMIGAFSLVAVSAHRQFRREGSALGLFDSMTLRQTVSALQRDYAAALEELTDALLLRADGGVAPEEPLGLDGLRLARRFELTDRQLAVLQQSAAALGHEREQVRRLGVLVRVGEQARVIRGETQLLAEVMALARGAFERDDLRLGLVRSGVLTFDDGRPAHPTAARALQTLRPVTSEDGTTIALPLAVKQHGAGLLQTTRRVGGFSEAERALLASLAGQISVALENARLYQQLDGLFRTYMSPAVATALMSDPDQAGLGGRVTEVSVLMADLRGFTTFSERHAPEAVVAMLNTYYGAVVPIILDHGGTVVQFVGDAVMAIFNAPTRQPDHARRAARAAIALQHAVETAAAAHADWPRFRVGINTGPALVGNIGSAQMRNFTAIGDTTNLAARLEAVAQPGQVVVSATTRDRMGPAVTRSLGAVHVQGRYDPVHCHVLESLTDPR
jgi:class 3 adenylate cyclase